MGRRSDRIVPSHTTVISMSKIIHLQGEITIFISMDNWLCAVSLSIEKCNEKESVWRQRAPLKWVMRQFSKAGLTQHHGTWASQAEILVTVQPDDEEFKADLTSLFVLSFLFGRDYWWAKLGRPRSAYKCQADIKSEQNLLMRGGRCEVLQFQSIRDDVVIKSTANFQVSQF